MVGVHTTLGCISILCATAVQLPQQQEEGREKGGSLMGDLFHETINKPNGWENVSNLTKYGGPPDLAIPATMDPAEADLITTTEPIITATTTVNQDLLDLREKYMRAINVLHLTSGEDLYLRGKRFTTRAGQGLPVPSLMRGGDIWYSMSAYDPMGKAAPIEMNKQAHAAFQADIKEMFAGQLILTSAIVDEEDGQELEPSFTVRLCKQNATAQQMMMDLCHKHQIAALYTFQDTKACGEELKESLTIHAAREELLQNVVPCSPEMQLLASEVVVSTIPAPGKPSNRKELGPFGATMSMYNPKPTSVRVVAPNVTTTHQLPPTLKPLADKGREDAS